MNVFTCTSSLPYDKHSYQIVLKSGKKIMFDDWMNTQDYWLTHCQIPNYLDYIEVKDKKAVGFGK